MAAGAFAAGADLVSSVSEALEDDDEEEDEEEDDDEEEDEELLCELPPGNASCAVAAGLESSAANVARPAARPIHRKPKVRRRSPPDPSTGVHSAPDNVRPAWIAGLGSDVRSNFDPIRQHPRRITTLICRSCFSLLHPTVAGSNAPAAKIESRNQPGAPGWEYSRRES